MPLHALARKANHEHHSIATWLLQGGSNLVLRQSGQVDSGEQAHIYGASVQQPVSLQFYPDGYDWAEAEPVPLWHGTSSDQVLAKLGILEMALSTGLSGARLCPT